MGYHTNHSKINIFTFSSNSMFNIHIKTFQMLITIKKCLVERANVCDDKFVSQ